jgi:hypothetical protein
LTGFARGRKPTVYSMEDTITKRTSLRDCRCQLNVRRSWSVIGLSR